MDGDQFGQYAEGVKTEELLRREREYRSVRSELDAELLEWGGRYPPANHSDGHSSRVPFRSMSGRVRLMISTGPRATMQSPGPTG